MYTRKILAGSLPIFKSSSIISSATCRLYSTYFSLFPKTFKRNIPDFEININDLRNEYRELQAAHHPDAKNDTDDLLSAKINKAFETLKDPLKRSEYILSINDVKLEEANLENQELLFEVMQVHEDLQNVHNANDVEIIDNENKKRIQEIISELQNCYKKNDLQNAAILTSKLKYWKGVETAIDNWYNDN